MGCCFGGNGAFLGQNSAVLLANTLKYTNTSIMKKK